MDIMPEQGNDPSVNQEPEDGLGQSRRQAYAEQAPGDPGPTHQSGSDSDAGPEVLGGPSQDPTRRDPQEWVTGDDPATEAQKSYLDRLAREAGEQIPADGLTKAQASEHIDRLQDETGMQPRQS